MISAQFVLGKGWTSTLIAYRGGRYSHVDIVLPDGKLLGARSDKVGGAPAGVEIRPPDYCPWAIRDRYDLGATKEQTQKFYDFAMDQIGKPYDKIGILGFIAARNWREDDSWFCSELFMAAIEAAFGTVLPLKVNKIDPTAASLVFSALGARPYEAKTPPAPIK